MKILIQSAGIISSGSPFHQKRKNILLNNGRIAEIGDRNFSADRVIKADGMLLSPGWTDIGAFSGDPGFEHKEDNGSLSRAAAFGGFTEVAVLPNTLPPVQHKNEVQYITQSNDSRLVQLHALASVTKNNKGEELTEMIDLHEAGAIGFTDGLKPVWHTDIFLKALQYLQKFDGVLLDHSEDLWLNMFGQMNEGVTSTTLGLKGMPNIAEEVAIGKNIELLGYAGGRLHFSRISTARSVELIRAGKRKGYQITCDAAAYQPLLDDTSIESFDTYYKVNPPLRTKSDADALIKGLKDDTIDILCSGHLPQDDESKNLEFDLADFGMINLQTFASQITSLSKWIPIEDLIEKIAVAPRRLLRLPVPAFEPEEKANFTLFDPEHKWVFEPSGILSKSRNSPWIGKELTGKAVAVFNNSRHWIDA